LKQEYKDDITVEEAIGLVMRTMSKTMDSTTLGSEKRTTCSFPMMPTTTDATRIVEFAVLTVDPVTKEPRAKIYRPAEIDALLVKHDLAKKDEDTEMKAA